VLEKIHKSLEWLRVLAQEVPQGTETDLVMLAPGGFTIFVWLYDGPNGDMMDTSGMANMMKEIQEQENRFELLIYSIEGTSNILFPEGFQHSRRQINNCPTLTQVIDKCKEGPPSIQEQVTVVDFSALAASTNPSTSQHNGGVSDQRHNQQEGSSRESNNPAETSPFLIGGPTQIGMIGNHHPLLRAARGSQERTAEPPLRKVMSEKDESAEPPMRKLRT